MAFYPYLAFAGNCREAFTRYQEIFGGELAVLTTADMPADAGPPAAGTPSDAVMHAALTSGDELLMGADDPSGGFNGTVQGMCVNCRGIGCRRSQAGVRCLGRWRTSRDAIGRDLLLACVRHVHGPLRHALDGDGGDVCDLLKRLHSRHWKYGRRRDRWVPR